MLPVPASASRGNIEVCQALFSPLSAAIKETLLCWRAENYTLMLALGPAVPCPGLCPLAHGGRFYTGIGTDSFVPNLLWRLGGAEAVPQLLAG